MPHRGQRVGRGVPPALRGVSVFVEFTVGQAQCVPPGIAPGREAASRYTDRARWARGSHGVSSIACPNCSTKLQEQDRSCPNCGRRRARRGGKAAGGAKAKSKLMSSSSLDSTGSGDLSPDSTGSGDLSPDATDSGDVSPDSEAQMEEPEIELSVPIARAPVQETEAADSAPPSAAQIRALIAEDPERIEPGLEIYTDKAGKLVGVGYPTPVGKIDLLARDAKEALVVILVAESGKEAELAASVLQRMGWVQKRLDAGEQTVRGLILVESVPETLLYAAAALPENVGIRTYRMALCFDVVEA